MCSETVKITANSFLDVTEGFIPLVNLGLDG